MCGKFGHYANQCYKKHNKSNYASTSDQLQNLDNMLVMNHVSSGSGDYDECDSNWYIDSGCSNHMSCNENVFENLHAPTEFSYVQTGDDSKHCIEHVGNVPLHNSLGSAKRLSNVLHVPTISVGQIVEKGLQVRFTQRGCFVENPRKGFKIVAKGERKGRLFTMDINNSDTVFCS